MYKKYIEKSFIASLHCWEVPGIMVGVNLIYL